MSRLAGRRFEPSEALLERFGFLLTVLFLSCCASAHRIPSSTEWVDLRQASPEEVRAAYEDYCAGVQTFSGSGDLEVQDLRAGRSRKVGVRFVATRGGRLYLKGSVLVVTAVEVVSDGQRFWLQVPSKKKVWTGTNEASRDASGADEAPYYVLKPRDISAALLPEPLTPGEGDAVLFDAQARAFCLAVGHVEGSLGRVRRRVCLDRQSLRLARVQDFDAVGELVREASFGDWTTGGLPRHVTIARPRQGLVASFQLDKAQANVTVPDRAFAPRIPDGYQVEEVGG
jgi:outer membrane lipoprotein-sorting protein